METHLGAGAGQSIEVRRPPGVNTMLNADGTTGRLHPRPSPRPSLDNIRPRRRRPAHLPIHPTPLRAPNHEERARDRSDVRVQLSGTI